MGKISDGQNGNTKKNKVQVRSNLSLVESIHTIIHEFGHTAGLKHQDDPHNTIGKSVAPNNFMWSPYLKEFIKKFINRKQLREMDQYIDDK